MYILKELSKDEIMLSGLKALIAQTPNQIAINKEGTTDLIANEKANTYSPVVTQQQKQYFSGGDGGNNQNTGAATNAQGMTSAQHGAFKMARGGIASL